MDGVAAQPLMKALTARKSAILGEWLARTIQAYPEHSARFLLHDKDPFRNPVGSTLKAAFPVLLDALLDGTDLAAVGPALDGVVRIRAVQDFTASQAVAFLFLLKPLLREALSRPPHPPLSPRAGGEDAPPRGYPVPGGGVAAVEVLAAVEGRIDQMALHAFDLFMRCREQVYEIKANEARRRIGMLLKRCGVEGGNGDTENGPPAPEGLRPGGGDGNMGCRITDTPLLRFAGSPTQDWSKP
jgi:hypothetical protein